MEYRDLKAFLAVARCGSYVRAAAQLNLAQSALSRRVLRLEQGLGVQLIARGARGVTVTEAGRELQERGERIDLELQGVEHDLRAGLAAQDVRIAAAQGAARLLTIPVVERARAAFPALRLHVFEHESARNQARVAQGEVDLALAYAAEENPDMTVTPLLIERIVVIGPAHGREAMRRSYSLAQLADLPLILPGHPHGYRRIIERLTSEIGRKPTVVLEVDGFATSLTMVQQDRGFTISTYSPMQSSVEAGQVRAAPIECPRCEVLLSLVERRGARSPAVVAALRRIILEVGAAVPRSPHWRPAGNRSHAEAR